MAIAGPFTNLLIIIFATHLKIELFSNLIIIYANLLLILFNLVPIYPLDGGRILKGILHIFLGKRKSRKIYEFNFIYYINNINVYSKYRDILHGKYFCIHNYYFFSLGIIFKTR